MKRSIQIAWPREMDADIAVIGSGAGGAVVSKELAELGYNVVIIEEGRYFTREDFNLNPLESILKMYRQAGQSLAIGTPLFLLPLGCTVGGTTTINSGTCLRMPRRVLKRWQLSYGLTDIDETEMDLLYKAVEEFLFVKRADPETAGKNAQIFLEAAQKMGLSGGWLPRNAKDCEGFGVCAFGCPSDAKQSMNVSYIPAALAAGATLLSRCRAERIIINKDGCATGVSAIALDPSPAEIKIHARIVVLAAGAIYSPYLLLKQKIGNSSGQVGLNLHIHPCVSTIAELDRRLDNPKGIPQSSYIDEFAADDIMLEGGTMPPGIHAMNLPLSGRKHRLHMNSYPYTGIFGGMISETGSGGTVTVSPLLKDRPLVRYRFRGADLNKAKFAVSLMARIWFAAGARKVYTPIAGFSEITGARQLADLERARLKPSDFDALTAYHPMGTCRMGADAKYSVVKSSCESWDVERLYIVDGSIIPTSLGVNPQLTIMALAMRAAGIIDERLQGEARRKLNKPEGRGQT